MADVLGTDVVGFGVEAIDGEAGTVRAVTEDVGSSLCLVVKPGPLRKKHVIPVAAVRRVDGRRHRVLVRMTKHQIRDAPEPWELGPWEAGPVLMSNDPRLEWGDPKDRWVDRYPYI